MTDSPPITVLAVDDDPLVLAAYRLYFSARRDLTLVGEAATGSEAVALFARVRPRVVLMDLQLPDISGVEATRRICSRSPDACVLAITTFGTREFVVAALRAGAAGYLLKDLGAQQLAAGIIQAVRGDMPLASSVRRELVAALGAEREAMDSKTVQLTSREQEVLQGLLNGQSNRQMSRSMFVSEGSIKQYLAAIGSKFGVSSRTQILVRAIQLRFVDPAPLEWSVTGRMASSGAYPWSHRGARN